MNELFVFIFYVFIIIIFFGISITSISIWIKSFAKTKEILKDPNKHWSFKAFIYYGIFFSIFITFIVFLSMVIGLAMFMWSFNV